MTDPKDAEDAPTQPPRDPEETHPPSAADREGAVTLRAEEEEADEEDEDLIVIAAEEALRDEDDIAIDALLDDDGRDPEVWLPVTDLDEGDIPILDVAQPDTADRWTPVDDRADGDVPVEVDDDVAREDPWADVVDDGEPEPERAALPAPVPPPAPLRPPTRDPRRPLVPRVLPWRSLVTPLAPEMGRTLLTTDPTRDRSALLVSSWSWLDTAGEPLLHFRLADDAAAVTVRSEAADHALVRCTLAPAGVPVEVLLEVETTREGVGIVLGRDALAGRFLVDPGREELDAG